jgi:hypothetical protein
MNIPVKLAIAGLNATDLATKASNIEAAMTDNPTFANPTPTLAELQSARVELETLMASSATGNRSAIAARRAQEGVVANLLRKLAVYVKLTAISEAEVLSAGFDVRSSNTPMRVLMGRGARKAALHPGDDHLRSESVGKSLGRGGLHEQGAPHGGQPDSGPHLLVSGYRTGHFGVQRQVRSGHGDGGLKV